MRSRIVYGFTAKIYRGAGEMVVYEKTLPRGASLLKDGGSFTSLAAIKRYIKWCEARRLDLEDSEIWSGAYLPATEIIDEPGVYQGRVEFVKITVKVIHSNEPLMGCDPRDQFPNLERLFLSLHLNQFLHQE